MIENCHLFRLLDFIMQDQNFAGISLGNSNRALLSLAGADANSFGAPRAGGALPSRENDQIARRLAAEDRIPESAKALREEWERTDTLAARAYSKITGISEHHVKHALGIAEDEPDRALMKAFENILKARSVSGGKIKALEDGIAAYERWAAKAEADPAFVELASKSISNEEMTSALLACGARYFDYKGDSMDPVYYDTIPEGAELGLSIFVEGDHTATSSAPECFERFLEFKTAATNQSKAFLTFIKDIGELDSRFRERLIERFMDLTKQAESVFYEHMPSSLVDGIMARQLAFSAVTVPALVAIQPLISEIKKVQALGAVRVFELLEGGESLPGVLAATLPRVEKAFHSSPLPLARFADLLAAVPQSERYDLFDATLKVPELVGLLRSARTHCALSESDTIFKFAALADSNPQLTQQILSDLVDLEALGDRKISVALALSWETKLLSGEASREQLFDCLRRFSKFHLVATPYIDALTRQETPRLQIITAALALTQNGQELQFLASRLASLSPTGLQALLEKANGDNSKCAEMLIAKKFVNPSEAGGIARRTLDDTPKQARTGKPWLEELVTDLAEGRIENRALLSEADVRSAYQALAVEYRSRLRRVWQNSPEVLTDICSDIMVFNGQPWFEQLIRDSYLFSNYRKKLLSNSLEVRQFLEQMQRNAGETTLNEVREWMTDARLPRLPAELRPVHSVVDRLPAQALARRFDRIIIWGHFHSIERREKLAAAAGDVPLILHDSFERRLSTKNGVSSGDIVLCLTKAMNHKQYYAVKRDCASKGAFLMCTSHEGTDILEEIVSKIASNKRAA